MRRFFKWAGIVVLSLIVLLLLVGGVLFYVGSAKVEKTYEVSVADLELASDSAALAYGEHLTYIHGCRDCHTPTLGGQVFVDAPPFRVTASNLTSGEGGIGASYSAKDFDRAIRHGLRPSGQALFIMPSAAFHRMSDSDAAALISYLQHAPPVDNVLPPTEVRVPGRILASAMIDPSMEVRLEPARSEPPPPVGPTSEYGEYLTSMTCAYCHGDDLHGMQPPNPDSPPAPSLVAAGQWTLDQFKNALRTGERPGGVPLNPEFMPISFTQAMSDVELEALHAYLSTLTDEPPL